MKWMCSGDSSGLLLLASSRALMKVDYFASHLPVVIYGGLCMLEGRSTLDHERLTDSESGRVADRS